jgi:hypothetical protein
MLARVYQNRPAPRPCTSPADVIPHWVDPPTGLVIKVGCAPQHGFARPELFLKGIEPAAYCPGKEAPPANPFPTDRRLFQRNQEAQKIAQQRAEEARRLAEQEAKRKEQERLARLEQEKREEEKEQARLAEIAREEQQKKEKLAAARKAAETERERAALKAREERIAREEAAASRREAEIAAREKEEQEKDRRAKEAAAREEARLQRLREQRNDEDADQVAMRDRRHLDEDRSDSGDERETTGQDLSGWWELTNTIASTNYAAYRGLRLTYRLQLEQDGDHLTGRGQKWAEEGAPVSAAARSPISVTGRIEGNKVILQFTEQGARRSTTGSFAWTLTPNGNALRGTFWSTAADTSGGSVARRLR